MTPGKTVVQSGFATFEAVQILQSTTVRIVTKKPDPLVPVRVAQMGSQIIPQAHNEEGVKELARKPVGSGAYKFVEWCVTTGSSWRRTASGGDGTARRRHRERIVWKPIPTTSRAVALQRGEVDIITNVRPDQMKIVKTLGVVDALRRCR
jgi:peptide/nickel transport system substrate-binding protein